MVANPPSPMPPPPPQPNHPHKTNGIRNGSSASYGRPPPAEGIDQAQSSMANMNLHTSTLTSSGGSRPIPPSPRVAGMMPPPPPPPPPGRPIPSTPGRTVAAPLHRFSHHPPPPSSFGSSPVTMPPAPSTARSTVGYAPSLATTAATPSRGPLVAPSNNYGGMRPPPPPSPMHHHHHHHQYNNPQIQSQIQPQKPTPSDPRSMSGDSSAGSMGRPLPPPSNVNGTRFTQPPPSQMHHPYQPSIRQPPSQHPSAIQPPRQQIMERPHNDAPNFQGPPPPPSQQFQNNTAPPPPSPYSHTTPQPPPPPPPMPAPPQPPYNTNSMQQPQHHVQQSRPPPGPQPPQPPGPPQQQHYPQQQHHQQQQQMLQQQYQKQLQPKEKIDPSQIPRIPLFTRPHHAPATIYPPVNDPHVARNNAMNSYGAPTTTTSTKSASESPILPPSDARYVTSSEYENASPRLMRSTVHAFPADNSTSRKCDLPLGLVVTPLGGLSRSCGSGASEGASSDPTNEAANNDGSNHVGQSSSSQWNGRDQGEIYGDSDNGTNENNLEGELDYVPPPTADDGNAMADPERVPVLRGPKRLENDKGDRHIQFRTRAVTPPRCNRCNAYLNPYSTPVAVSNFLRGAYSPVQAYDCNMCGASGSIVLSEEAISNGTFDAATRCGTVEYEVGGAYCVRKEGPVQNVHLYGVEYVPPNSTGVAMADHHHHHHHGTIKSHGWLEALDAIREVGRGLSITAPKKEDKVGTLVSDVRIGVFAFYQDMLIFPYLKRPHPRVDVDVSQDCVEQEMDAELEVAIMPDVTDDPFCPLPLHMWTHNVGNGLNSIEWKHFNRVLDSFSELMERLVSELPSIPTTNNNSRQQDQSTRNCGGAALAALASALHDSGGRATLITTRRPNHGLGGLRDREGNQPQPQRVQYALAGQAQQQRSRVSKKSNPYQRAPDEQRLFIPLQRLVKPTKGLPQNIFGVDAECNDGRAGLFYRELGERCARQRICIDIVVTSSLVNMSSTSSSPAPSSMNVGPRSVHPNPREFLDVATLAELCRATCGDFKWLRAGNECGVKVGNGNNDNGVSFTGEQLREELKRSALAYSGSDAVFKLRCSHGVQVKSYSPTLPVGTLIGDGIVNSAELELSNLNSSTSVAVLLEHKLGGVQDTRGGGRKGIDSPMVFFQAATLYTTLTGRRRVRVSTLGLVTTKVPSAVYRSADLGTVAAIMTRQAISDLDDPNEGSLHNAQSKVFQKCVSILANYRLHTTAKSSPVGQLILPESLQLLPLFCLSLRKSRLFRNSSVPFKAPFPTADERAYHIFYGRMISPNMSLQCVHPNLFRVSDMRMRDGEWITPPALETNGISGDEQVTASSMRPVCQLPKSLNPSIACLDEEEMYLLDDRFAFYLFIGKGVPEEKWRELLSVSTATGAQRVDGQWVNNVPMGELSIASTEAGHKLRNILEQLRRLNSPNDALAMNLRPSYAPLVLIFVGRGSVYEEEMDSLLVDDPVGREKSYVDFLCDVHKAVREESTTEF